MAIYEYKMKDGSIGEVRADTEEEARRIFRQYERDANLEQALAKVDTPDTAISSAGRALMEPLGVEPEDLRALPAAIESTGRAIGSSFGIGDDKQTEQIIERNRPLLETPGGTATEIGVQGIALLPLAKARAAAAATQTLKNLPKAAQALMNIGEAGIGGALLADPGKGGDVGAGGAGIQTAFEVGREVLPRSLKTAAKHAGKGADWLSDQFEALLKTNPGMTMSQAATRLKELVPDIDIPLANALDDGWKKRIAQLFQYVNLGTANDRFDDATLAVRRKLMEIAEGKTPTPGQEQLPFIPPEVASIFSKEGMLDFLKTTFTKGDKKAATKEWREMNQRFGRMNTEAARDYDTIINRQTFDGNKTFSNILRGIRDNENSLIQKQYGTVQKLIRDTLQRGPGGKPVVNGATIGTLKGELRRRMGDTSQFSKPERDAYKLVLKQLDEDLAAQMSPEDAKRFRELNKGYPDRKLIEESIADAPLGEFVPAQARSATEKGASTAQLAAGTARSQELIDTAVNVLKTPPPRMASPFAVGAIIGTLFMDAGIGAAVIGTSAAARTDLARAIKNGNLPPWMKGGSFEKEWTEKLQSMTVPELVQMLESAIPSASAIGTEQAVGEN